MDTYFPDDINTRFTDVWGQDHVLEQVKENIVFLEDPEAIENKGGYVPGGLLLWGPPGTGKTLMAEAVAGETGKPYVFVDPGAFTNMFMGVGILKVKSLFRKLRKLALRYGGVIVFFDEADALGSRGALAQVGPAAAGWSGHAVPARGCNGLSYLSVDTRSLLSAAMRSAPSRSSTGAAVHDGRHGRWRRRHGHAAGPAHRAVGPEEAARLHQPRRAPGAGMRPKPPPKYRILVMMATNMPQALDEALLRPGRIDRIYKVGYPSKAGRVRTYEGYLDKVAHELTPSRSTSWPRSRRTPPAPRSRTSSTRR